MTAIDKPQMEPAVSLPHEVRNFFAEAGRIGGIKGQAALRRRFLVQVDQETPGLEEVERQARLRELISAEMSRRNAIAVRTRHSN
jgi:hypothetical protein